LDLDDLYFSMMLIGVLHANFVPTLMAGVGHTMETAMIDRFKPNLFAS
jgi:hypothetical protein|tara:strand:- start:800 stop:943 length:144 start_codon:yes stop_codon:yes gene_type:complete